MSTSITCPVSGERVNESTVRIVAFLVTLITIAVVTTGCYPVMLLVGVDFALRAFTSGKWSALKKLAVVLTGVLRFSVVKVDAAPKKFAAGVGAFFCFAVFAFGWLELPTAEYAVAGVLVLCAVLESVFAYCVGCVVYSFLQNIALKRWAAGRRL